MEKDQIESFLKLAELGCSFTKTALALHTSQPAISRKMAELQRELGKDLPLFEPDGRRKKLTVYGEELRNELQDLRDRWNVIAPRLQEKAGAHVNAPVRVGAGATAAHYLLPDAVEQFHRENPDVELSIRIQLFSETIKSLRAGELDFALRSAKRDDIPKDLRFQPVKQIGYKLIVPKGSPLKKVQKAEDLKDQAFVGASEGTRGYGALQRYFAQRGVPIRMALQVGGWDLAKTYVSKGLGIALVPEFCLLPGDRRKVSVRPAPEGFPVDEYGILQRKGRYLPATAKALMGLILT
ncbi:MAG: hypothetical protein CO113_04125 [Elusimicrobia bacterium CG_4_9_14_3_um_filter_62_55]|nr:MAG: hypothetical protein CO113_04125 [Elusimicrobia bacterium CG_4_9_14_3_um_filter_62_55]